jgi:AraC-like DNA-binding protein
MTQPAAFARHARHLRLTATLTAYHAARLLRQNPGKQQFAADRCGYLSPKAMRRAIRKYVKSPAPTGIGNGAQAK